MFIKRGLDQFVVGIVLIGLCAVTSIKPTLVLRTDMPQEFKDAATTGSGSKGRSGDGAAQGYWLCATTVIAHEYSAGSRLSLPSEPPPEFRITSEDVPLTRADAMVRDRCWRALRKAWVSDSSWKQTYVFNFGWIIEPVRAGGKWLKETFGLS